MQVPLDAAPLPFLRRDQAFTRAAEFLQAGAKLLVGEVGGSLRVLDVADGRTLRQAILRRGMQRFAVDRPGRHVATADVLTAIEALGVAA